MTDVTSPAAPPRSLALWLLGFVLLAALGVALRVYPSSTFQGRGYDEQLYRNYVIDLARGGIASYPDLADQYIARQRAMPGAILPPTRFLYIFCGYLWHTVAGGDEPVVALHRVSTLFSVLLLAAAAAFAWRLGGRLVSLTVLALMSCAPTQIHMAQHALVDGFFAFWATLSVWFLWENLKQPNHSRWLLAYFASLLLLVITKENAAFAYIGLLALLAANRWLFFGAITPRLLLVTVAGPLAGVVILVFLSGGLQTFVDIYRLLVSKASVLPYAIATGDGPWYRYLVDLLLASPLTLLLAWGALFRMRAADKASLYLVAFVAATYVVMCNVRYGMNLRYTNMWDMPLRYLAVVCLTDLTQSFRRHRNAIFATAIALLCLFDLRQYYIFFVAHDLYELVTAGLLHALNILK